MVSRPAWARSWLCRLKTQDYILFHQTWSYWVAMRSDRQGHEVICSPWLVGWGWGGAGGMARLCLQPLPSLPSFLCSLLLGPRGGGGSEGGERDLSCLRVKPGLMPESPLHPTADALWPTLTQGGFVPKVCWACSWSGSLCSGVSSTHLT